MAFEFPHPGITRRKPRQRYDKSFFSLSDGPRGTPPGSVIKQVGEGQGYQGYSRHPQPLWYYEVTLPSGIVVPCYSFSPAGSNGYVICQTFAYKAYIPAN